MFSFFSIEHITKRGALHQSCLFKQKPEFELAALKNGNAQPICHIYRLDHKPLLWLDVLEQKSQQQDNFQILLFYKVGVGKEKRNIFS